MLRFFRTNSAIDETAATTKKRSLILIALICLVVYMVGALGSNFITAIPTYAAVSEDPEVVALMSQSDVDNETMSKTLDEALTRFYADAPIWVNYVNLFSTVAVIIAVVAYCVIVEKRRLFTVGLAKKGMLREYLVGLLIGVLMFSFAYGCAILSGDISFGGFNASVSYESILIFFLAYIIQGASEEIMLRGFLFTTVAANQGVLIALLLNSGVFAWLHFANPGITPLAVFNLFLFGVFATLYYLRRGSIWGICAIHSVWNFAQGNIFGCSVSGGNVSETLFTTVHNGSTLWSGGAFGPEGGLGVTVVFAIGIIVLAPMKNKNIKDFFSVRCKHFF